MNHVKYLVVHCTATPASMDIGVKEITGWHKQRKPPFRTVGYHYVIRRDGTIEKGRANHEIGAHALGYNTKSLGISLVGGVKADGKTPETNFTPAQWETLKSLLRSLSLEYGNPPILGHNDTYPTACPTFNVPAWVRKELPELVAGNVKPNTAILMAASGDEHDEFRFTEEYV